jgi:hypothetical protein
LGAAGLTAGFTVAGVIAAPSESVGIGWSAVSSPVAVDGRPVFWRAEGVWPDGSGVAITAASAPTSIIDFGPTATCAAEGVALALATAEADATAVDAGSGAVADGSRLTAGAVVVVADRALSAASRPSRKLPGATPSTAVAAAVDVSTPRGTISITQITAMFR